MKTKTPKWQTKWTAARIKGLRKKYGESQVTFATRFRVSVQAYRTWEQDVNVPGGPVTLILDQLEALSRAKSAKA